MDKLANLNDVVKLGEKRTQEEKKKKMLTIKDQIKDLPADTKLSVIVNTKRESDSGTQLVGVGRRTVEFKTGEEIELPVWAIKLITDENACFYIEHQKTGDINRPTKTVRKAKYTVNFV